MRRCHVSGKTMLATLVGELLLIIIAAAWYGGVPNWEHGDEGPPSVTVHFQTAPVPLARSHST